MSETLAIGGKTAAPCKSSLRAPPPSPLYLDGMATAVDLDGPALLVRGQRRAPARYPLVRVSRVVTHVGIEWRMRALKACLEHRIPVVFLGSEGEPAGYLVPKVRCLSRLDVDLQEFTDRPDWMELYRTWLRAERMRILRGWQDGLHAGGEPVSEEGLRELKRRYVHQQVPIEGLNGAHTYRAAILALVAERAQKAGLRGIYWGFGGERLDLIDDLAGLLELALVLELLGLGHRVEADAAALFCIFHTFAARLAKHWDGVIGRLHAWLRRLHEEWR